MSRRLSDLQDLADTLSGSGVKNEMFFGVPAICYGIFNNEVRPDLLRRWIQFAGFPAPRLPKGRFNTRVTTWGLVEAWLMVMAEYESPDALEELANPDRSHRQKVRVISILKILHSRRKVNAKIKEVEGLVEAHIEARIRRRVGKFEKELREDVQKALGVYSDDGTSGRTKRGKKVKRK